MSSGYLLKARFYSDGTCGFFMKIGSVTTGSNQNTFFIPQGHKDSISADIEHYLSQVSCIPYGGKQESKELSRQLSAMLNNKIDQIVTELTSGLGFLDMNPDDNNRCRFSCGKAGIQISLEKLRLNKQLL